MTPLHCLSLLNNVKEYTYAELKDKLLFSSNKICAMWGKVLPPINNYDAEEIKFCNSLFSKNADVHNLLVVVQIQQRQPDFQ